MLISITVDFSLLWPLVAKFVGKIWNYVANLPVTFVS